MAARRRAASAPALDKERMIALIEDQPDDSSFDDLLRELAFARMVERGLADALVGRTIASAELKRRIRHWPN